MKELLIDCMPFTFTQQTINESAGGDGMFIVRGVLQRANAKNQNGRVYPRNILEREVQKYNRELVSIRNALGELDHPESSIVNLKNASHNIREIFFNGDDVMGVVEILSTPSGNILKELFKNNITVGISSRGMGSVRPLGEGTTEVSDDYNLIAFDFVSNPSTHGAYMRPLNESKSVSGEEDYVCNEWCKSQDIMRKILMELQ